MPERRQGNQPELVLAQAEAGALERLKRLHHREYLAMLAFELEERTADRGSVDA